MTTTFETLKRIIVEGLRARARALTPETPLEDIEIDSLAHDRAHLRRSRTSSTSLRQDATGSGLQTLGDIATLHRRADRGARRARGAHRLIAPMKRVAVTGIGSSLRAATIPTTFFAQSRRRPLRRSACLADAQRAPLDAHRGRRNVRRERAFPRAAAADARPREPARARRSGAGARERRARARATRSARRRACSSAPGWAARRRPTRAMTRSTARAPIASSRSRC